jgi:ribose/xylose/arabinose/galactoside ABC-type transport system permease subunit
VSISGQPRIGEVQELYSIAAVVIGGGRSSGGRRQASCTTLMGCLVLVFSGTA